MICTVLCRRLKGGGVEGVRWKRNSSSGQLHKWLANEMVMFMTPVFKKKKKKKARSIRGEGEEARSHMQLPQHLCNKTVPNASRLKRRFVGVKGASLPVAAASAAEICSGKYFNRGGGMGRVGGCNAPL